MARETVKRYIITESSPSQSLDPLDADSTQNLPVARMVYLTPLEVSDGDSLSSTLLSEFGYKESERTVFFRVRSGMKYADNSDITADDVAFAVARMAKARPQFPVIRDIEGLSVWIDDTRGLAIYPTGIKVSGDLVSIKFTQSQAHPLYRFCLELFSVIPKRCVDPATSKLTCTAPPASGYYSLIETGAKHRLFKARHDQFPRSNRPELIRFEYMLPAEVLGSLDQLDADTVVAGREGSFSASNLKTMREKTTVRLLPQTRFSGILFNPNVEPFTQRECRLVFADDVRKAYVASNPDKAKAEGSIFTRIVPGYLTLPELAEDAGAPDASTTDLCRKKIRELEVVWRQRGHEQQEMVAYMRDNLGYSKIKLLPADAPGDLSELFLNGKIHVVHGSSGFWPFDPVGDLSMLFTPNLHKDLRFTANHPDLRKDLELLQSALKPDKRLDILRRINRWMFRESLFAIYGHQSRFFCSKAKTAFQALPMSVTAPSPWQVFP